MVFSGEEAFISVETEGVGHEGIALHELQRFEEGAGEIVDAVVGAGSGVHGENIFGDFFWWYEPAFDAIKSGCQADGERQIWVAGWIWAAEFDAGALTARCWDANERGAVGG